MQKAYQRINWENYPSENTPVNEENLNRLDHAVDELDNRTITLDTSKATKTEISTLISEIEWNEDTGVITFTRKNGSKFTIDTKLEKLAVNFGYDQKTEKLVITLSDGTIQYVDMSALITQYEFLNSDTIAFQLENGKVKAVVKEGSIEERHMQPNYLADIKVEVANAEGYANAAASSATQADASATEAESYARGGTDTREGEDTDNAKYYADQARQISQGINGIVPMGTVTFANLPTKDIVKNAMYNVSDAFTSDERFNDGGSVYYGPGNNVIWTAEGKWDVTAASNVTGIKGAKETTYRQGNVNITPENIGAATEENFADMKALMGADDISHIAGGTVTGAVSEMHDNIMDINDVVDLTIGETDITKIGDGTLTGGLVAVDEKADQNAKDIAATNESLPIIKKGVAYCGYATTVTQKSVTFDEKFDVAPIVLITQCGIAAPNKWYATVNNVTTTGFTINTVGESTINNIPVHWVAIANK